jgi:hypothetical protein
LDDDDFKQLLENIEAEHLDGNQLISRYDDKYDFIIRLLGTHGFGLQVVGLWVEFGGEEQWIERVSLLAKVVPLVALDRVSRGFNDLAVMILSRG